MSTGHDARDSAPLARDAVICVDLAGTITSWNDAAENLYGYSSAEIVGRNVSMLLLPGVEGETQELIEIVSAGKQISRLEARHRRKDGSLAHLEVTFSPMRDPANVVAAISIVCHDITTRKAAEEALRRSQFSLDNVADYMIWSDVDASIIDVSESTCRQLQYSREELQSMTLFDLDPRLSEQSWRAHWSEIRARGSRIVPAQHRKKDGEILPLEISANHFTHEGTEYDCAFCRDITDRKQAEETLRRVEEQLRQSQKMEAVGQLAGGIAHDFNNVLTAIIGYSQLILDSREPLTSTQRDDVEEIKTSAERASALTRQILAFSRRQALQPQVLCVNDIVTDTERLIRRTLGENIELLTRLAPDLGLAEIDRNQFEQVLVNMALNARDAMPDGGRLTLETQNVDLDKDFSGAHPDAVPGPHVMLTICDDGIGMSEETRSRVFEPFFTTKELGTGTGLGLAVVYGVVSQSGGTISVDSRLGAGTVFKIYLPRVEKPAQAKVEPAGDSPAPSGPETILVVEDEEAVRNLVMRALGGLGYSVLSAGSGIEALNVLNGGQHIDLLLTDVVLPGGIQGNDLAATATVVRPELPVLYMSGYARDTIVHSGRLDPGVSYLGKPFTPDELARRVRETLDAS